MNRIRASFAALALATAACSQAMPAAVAAEETVRAPVADRISRESEGLKNAYFAGGCFWGVEAVFSHVPGVTSAVSGYHGGNAATAKYDIVSSGVSQHAETVKVTYDPKIVRYDQLLRIFFSVVHDPTQLNRQGPDRGAHYRSALIPVSADQRAVARAYIDQLEAADLWDRPIVTKIETAKRFYPAETYHQDFAHKNPRHGYIVRWDAPKVAALRRLLPQHYRSSFKTG